MDDIQKALADAWQRIRPMLENNPTELHRRLARRQNALISSPPRAWCLAVRATDTRLERYCCDTPDPAESHAVLLDSDALSRLCAPVHIPAPGLTIAQLARRLGVARAGLLHARVAGLFGHHYIRTARGNRLGGQQPLLFTDRPLDPSARLFAQPDPLWSITARHVPLRIPDDIEQTLKRVPLYHDQTQRYRDKSDLHPEHPDHDPPARRKKSLALPPPPPDYVAYKWKGDEYIGYDWRAAQRNPRIKLNYERRQARLAEARAAAKRRRQNQPAPYHSGSLKFKGWRWLCPECGRKVNLLYMPLPRLHLLPLPSWERAGVRGKTRTDQESPDLPQTRSDDNQRAGVRGRTQTDQACPSSQTRELENAINAADAASKRTAPKQKFACEHCHHIKRLSRCDKNSWNELVTYLSAGLLFGREVQRPAWLPRPEFIEGKPDRKIAYTPRPNRAPSERRPQIESKLLAGQSFQQIAAALGLAKGTVLWHAQQIYKQHGARTLPELLTKHNKPIPGQTHLTPEIRRRLLAGDSVAEIATALNVPRMMIYNQRQQMKKKGVKLKDARQFNRVGPPVKLPSKSSEAIPVRSR